MVFMVLTSILTCSMVNLQCRRLDGLHRPLPVVNARGSGDASEFKHDKGKAADAAAGGPPKWAGKEHVMYRKTRGWGLFALAALAAGALAGSAEAVIEISSIEALQRIGNDSSYPLDGHYLLTQDIDASETAEWNDGAGFDPIGGAGHVMSDPYEPFVGVLDGQGHVIHNLTIERPDQYGVGLFSAIGARGTVKNLGLENARVTGSAVVGALAGRNERGAIAECFAEGTIQGNGQIGGLVGRNEDGTITSSHTTGLVLQGQDNGGQASLYENAGGLVGKNVRTVLEGVMISDSHSSAEVSGLRRAGGLVGANETGAAIANSYATGGVQGQDDVGGLVGHAGEGSSIAGSHALGDVTGERRYAGGLVGRNRGVVRASHATGDVEGGEYVGGLIGGHYEGGLVEESHASGSVTGASRVGGLVGGNWRGGTIARSFSTAHVFGEDSVGGLAGSLGSTGEPPALISNSFSVGQVTAAQYAGGLVGVIQKGGRVEYSYSAGLVDAFDSAGGLIGHAEDAEVISSFWDVASSGQGASDGGEGLDRDVMMKRTAFAEADWEFEEDGGPWTLVEGETYPHFAWLPEEPVTFTPPIIAAKHGEVHIERTSATDKPWSTVTVTAAPDEGYQFAGWITPELPTGQRVAEPSLTIPLHEDLDGSVEFHAHFLPEGPIVIDSIEGLQRIGNEHSHPLHWDYVLGQSIDAADTASWNDGAGFEPIGSYPWRPFQGTLDGQGHAIAHLHIDRPGEERVGLFSVTDAPGVIEHVLVDNAYLSADQRAGVLVGWNRGAVIRDSQVTGPSVLKGDTVGGLVGGNFGGAVVRGSAHVAIEAGSTAGGLVGGNSAAITDSLASGVVNAERGAGGLVGTNTGAIQRSHATAEAHATDIAGGLVGSQDDGGVIQTSFAAGVVTGENDLGGLLGRNRDGHITRSYATGTVTGKTRIGGLVGSQSIMARRDHPASIVESYAVSTVRGEEEVGGLIGYRGDDTVVDRSFWDVRTSGRIESQGGEALETAALMTRATFDNAGWDFAETWTIEEGVSYPHFQHAAGGEGKLNVTLTPPAAVENGAQWSADQGASWHDSEQTIELPGGGRPVAVIFSDVEGKAAPAPLSAAIREGETVFLEAHYDPPGVIEVEIEIDAFTVKEARWRFQGTEVWRDSGDAVTGLEPGAYWVEFSDVEGWIAPDPIEVLVDGDEPATVNAVYEQRVGLLEVDIEPEGPATGLGRWRVSDETDWKEGGASAALPPGDYTVVFADVEGWLQPEPIFVTIREGQTTSITGVYEERLSGWLQVKIEPEEAIEGRAAWRIPGETAGGPGDAVELSAGAYEVRFSNVVRWIAPDPMTVDVDPGETTVVTGVYQPVEETPIEIDSLKELQQIGNDSAYPLDGHYILTQDIDASETAEWNGGKGFEPIGGGEPFTGSLDGQGFRISDLLIHRPSEHNVGLFSRVEDAGAIRDLALEGGKVTGERSVGAIAGATRGHALISGCFASVAVLGTENTGGLVGHNRGTITNSVAMGAVTGRHRTGGLAGFNSGVHGYRTDNPGIIEQCHAAGPVTGRTDVGGLLGGHRGQDPETGHRGRVVESYAAGLVQGDESTGGLVGARHSGGVEASFWDMDTSGQAASAGGLGLTTAEMMSAAPFTEAGWSADSTEGGDAVWTLLAGETYPHFAHFTAEDAQATLSVENGPGDVAITHEGTTGQPWSLVILTAEAGDGYRFVGWDAPGLSGRQAYMANPLPLIMHRDIEIRPVFLPDEAVGIRNIEQLQRIGHEPDYPLDGRYLLERDIDAAETARWNSGDGFWPIGYPMRPFTGSFRGDGHSISNMTINRGSESGVGLFGATSAAARIANLRLEDAEVAGEDYVGALVGSNSGEIRDAAVSGTVAAHGYGGGIAGRSRGLLSRTRFEGLVTGFELIGGVTGANVVGGLIEGSLAAGRVLLPEPPDSSGEGIGAGLAAWNFGLIRGSGAHVDVTSYNRAGGLVGQNRNEARIISSFATGDVSATREAGGLAESNSGGVIRRSYATGSVEAGSGVHAANGGGLLSFNGGVVSQSYAAGDVTVSPQGNRDAKAGGLIAWNLGDVAQTYALGSVTITTGARTWGGGLIGRHGIQGQGDSGPVLSESLAVGSVFVSGHERYYGGLIGARDAGVARASFWDVEKAGQAHSSGGTGLMTDELRSRAVFEDADWDFDAVWAIEEGVTYPHFLHSGVPDTAGSSHDAALAALEEAGLTLGSVTEIHSSAVPGGVVMGQTPVPGVLVDAGEPVDLVVSAGSASTGTVMVITDPEYAQWRIGDGEWRNSRATVTLPSGEHEVVFQEIEGWLTPLSRTVTVEPDGTNELAVTYRASGAGELDRNMGLSLGGAVLTAVSGAQSVYVGEHPALPVGQREDGLIEMETPGQPPGVYDVRVVDGDTGEERILENAFTYTANPFDEGLEPFPGGMRIIQDSPRGVTTSAGYMPVEDGELGSLEYETPEGVVLEIPRETLPDNATRAFVVIRSANSVASLFTADRVLPDGYSSRSPYADVHVLVELDGEGEDKELVETVHAPVTLRLPQWAKPEESDILEVGRMVTNLDEQFQALLPDPPEILPHAVIMGSYDTANRAVVEVEHLTVYGILGPLINGDVTRNGMVNARDIQMTINVMLGYSINPNYDPDLTGDGDVNAADIQQVINAVLGIE